MNETDTATFACSVCKAANAAQNKFCSGCGQSLWEKCQECGTSCRIGQNFCNGCGFNLLGETESKLEEARALIKKAEIAASEGRFKDAVRVLNSLTTKSDPRFAEIVGTAQATIEDYEQRQEKWAARVENLRPEVEQLSANHKYVEVVELLSSVPSGMLDDALVACLHEAEQNATSYAEAKANLKSAIDQKDWPGASTELVRLLKLKPNSEKYKDLLPKVASKILKSAVRLKLSGQHAAALLELESVPEDSRTEDHSDLVAELEELIFVRKLVARTRHLSPVVGAALQRLQKLTPDDKKVQQLAQHFAGVRKSRPEGMARFRNWMENESGLIPGGILPATFPPQMLGARPDRLVSAGGQFWIACGLALQGVGLGETSGELVAQSKKSMLSMLSRKKKVDTSVAWGIDIGDSHIKAVKMSRDGDAVRIEDALMYEIPASGNTRTHLKKPEASAILKCLKEMFADGMLAESTVVASVATADLLTRHMVLPVNAPKQHDTFIAQEAQANIPIAMELLATAYHKFAPADGSAMSQNVVLAAVKRVEVESRKSMLEQVAASGVVVVPEPFALFNLTKHCNFFGLSELNTRDVILVVDVGLSRSSINLLSRSGGWFRALEWGVDDLTRSVASELKITHADAEKLRLNPAGHTHLNQAIRALELATTVPRRELGRSMVAAKEQLNEYKLAQALLIGGGSGQSLLSSWINGEDL